MGEPVSYSTNGDIAVISINNPPVNAFGAAVAEGLARSVAQLQRDADVKAAVVMGAGSTFVAGADIKEFARMQAGEIPFRNVLNPVFKEIEGSAKPIVMAIHGAALGGGLELAMAGHYRIAVADAQVGQPEVKLGLIPGAGGTQRLPRLAGIAKAAEMCAGGNPIKAEEALHAGILDRLIEGELLAGALEFTREITSRAIPRTRQRDEKLRRDHESSSEILAAAREKTRQEQRGWAAAPAAIDAVEAATKLSFDEGMECEAQIFRERLFSEQAKALVYVFLGERELAKVPGIGKETPVIPMRKAIVVGSGETSEEMAKALGKAGISVQRGGEVNVDAVAEADLILANDGMEAVWKWEGARKADSILAVIDGGLFSDNHAPKHPETLAGLHFPLSRTRLMEVVVGRETNATTMASLFQLAKRLKKVAVLERESPQPVGVRLTRRLREEMDSLVNEGVSAEAVNDALYKFGFNEMGGVAGAPARVEQFSEKRGTTLNESEIAQRCVYAMANEGARILGDGEAWRAVDIDIICVLGYGFPAYRGGPMWMADQAGLDKVLAAVRTFYELRGERWKPAPLFEQLARKGKKLASVRPQ